MPRYGTIAREFCFEVGAGPDASLTFLQHWDSGSLNVENPTSPCQSELAAALQRGENKVTRQMGWGRGGKMKAAIANGVWQSHGERFGGVGGPWPQECLFPQDKEGSDTEHREEQHLIQPKEWSMRHGVVVLGRDASTGGRIKIWNKERPSNRTIAVLPGLFAWNLVDSWTFKPWQRSEAEAEIMPPNFKQKITWRDPKALLIAGSAWIVKNRLLTAHPAASLQLRNGTLSSSVGITGLQPPVPVSLEDIRIPLSVYSQPHGSCRTARFPLTRPGTLLRIHGSRSGHISC